MPNDPVHSLIALAAVTGFLHTIAGPDHYLPFVAMVRARGWSLRRTLRITLLCGAGHLGGSVALGLVGIAIGAQLAALEWLEGLRGDLAAWLLIGFGLAYTAWGIRQALRNRPHTHWHEHGGIVHRHGPLPPPSAESRRPRLHLPQHGYCSLVVQSKGRVVTENVMIPRTRIYAGGNRASSLRRRVRNAVRKSHRSSSVTVANCEAPADRAE